MASARAVVGVVNLWSVLGAKLSPTRSEMVSSTISHDSPMSTFVSPEAKRVCKELPDGSDSTVAYVLELRGMSRRDLQALAKKHGISASLKSEAIIRSDL